eukprot:362856-Chlamydomonas_euryale.AAC.22
MYGCVPTPGVRLHCSGETMKWSRRADMGKEAVSPEMATPAEPADGATASTDSVVGTSRLSAVRPEYHITQRSSLSPT